MTHQEAAYEILKKLGKPTSSKEIGRIAHDKKMVSSTAKDPAQSIAQTIEKNIRDGIYNNPKLVLSKAHKEDWSRCRVGILNYHILQMTRHQIRAS